jgi:succinyl-CoA synthetase alpha subunit
VDKSTKDSCFLIQLKKLVKKTGANASMIFVPPAGAADAHL